MTSHRALVYNLQRLLYPTDSNLARALDATNVQGWNKAAYRKKLDAVTGVLHQINGGAPPAIAVLIEVENDRVVRDLLRTMGWTKLVNVTPPEERVSGYDVVVLYDPQQVAGHRDAFSYTLYNRYSTRDVLRVTLDLGSAGPLHLIGVHWPSRKITGSESLRFAASFYCDNLVSEILKYRKEDLFDARGRARLPSRKDMEARWNTPLLIAGDFNDNPWDASVRFLGSATCDHEQVMRQPRFPSALGVKGVEIYLGLKPRLYNPAWSLPVTKSPPGTYFFGGDWQLLDQVLVSSGLLIDKEVETRNGTGASRTGPYFIEDSLRVLAPSPIQVEHEKARRATSRGGQPIAFDPASTDGVSDHLPLVFDLEW
jgi:endonuclease/exonuclease/phosphatase family metal-dependent hydrolase